MPLEGGREKEGTFAFLRIIEKKEEEERHLLPSLTAEGKIVVSHLGSTN